MKTVRAIKSSPTLTNQVYNIIRNDIVEGHLEPGLHLVQEELAVRFGVSRQPIQQAMLLLKADGLVIESGGRGLYVAPIDPERVRNHYQIRVALDKLAAENLAKRIAQGDPIREYLKTEGDRLVTLGQNAEKKHSAAEAVALDMQFHALIYECSGNPLIAATAEPHWSFLRRVMISVLLHAGRGAVVWTEHAEILGTLLSGNTKLVSEQVARHISGAEGALFRELEKKQMVDLL